MPHPTVAGTQHTQILGTPYYCPHGLTQNNQIWYDTTWESGMRIFGVSHAPM